MRIGVPAEIKVHEYRVGLTPGSVAELTAAGHEVVVQTRAGAGIGFHDRDYQRAGATIALDAGAVFHTADLIVKVKEPQAAEYPLLRAGQILFTYLHLAADRPQADALLACGVTAIAYETVTAPGGGLPLLAPMSEVAGRMAVQVGAKCLEKEAGGIGKLLGGVPGVAPAKVVILGGGSAGANAALIALGMQADVTILDRSVSRLRWLADRFGSGLRVVMANPQTIHEYVIEADLVIGAVLVPGAAAPKLVSREMVREMRDGSVLVDISIDQGGCFETTRPTTHENPTYVEERIVHYCVANIPGAFPRTSTFALTNATF
ncbi:MAG: alanine dehydrogenase, partial [Proteobacteria bacterium]|nr:alanine dehydrogenase [Pseudomonadota bacterium]